MLALAAATALVELALLASDWGLVGARAWRAAAYENGAFWRGLLDNWRPNYRAQPAAMFLTYAFLHGGPGHLAGNLITLAALGGPARARLGRAGFLALYAASAVGGGLGFALLGASLAPMVGASGALHGLAGAWLVWERLDRRDAGLSARPVLWAALALGALNLVMWAALDGLLAWEAHAGGLAAGWAAAAGMARAGPGRRPPGRGALDTGASGARGPGMEGSGAGER